MRASAAAHSSARPTRPAATRPFAIRFHERGESERCRGRKFFAPARFRIRPS